MTRQNPSTTDIIAQWHAMLNMQEDINTRIHTHWREQQHPWYRAIWVECAELMDHHGWKWWKHQQQDIQQIQLELVDIWHFGLSDCLQHQPADAINEASHTLLSQLASATDFESLLEGIEHFAQATLSTQRFSAADFFGLTKIAGLDMETLYKLYISKNVLNFFRQDHGYQTGKYHKVWSGKEDNEHLSDIVNGANLGDIEDWQGYVYQALEQRYPI